MGCFLVGAPSHGHLWGKQSCPYPTHTRELRSERSSTHKLEWMDQTQPPISVGVVQGYLRARTRWANSVSVSVGA